MHFISGGAFNGKRKWVKQFYKEDGLWLSAYEQDELTFTGAVHASTVILEGMEAWIAKEIDLNHSADILLDNIMNKMKSWLEWEQQEANHTLVVIGTDISKGVVPIDQAERLGRDITGWVYQRLAEEAERMDIIWYGINQTIKNKRGD